VTNSTIPPRRLHRAGHVAILLAALLTGATADAGRVIAETPVAGAAKFSFSLEPVATGFERPVHVADPGDGSGRLFVVEQAGRIRIVRDGQILPAPFLDLTDRVGCCGERGLLSVAFHPAYASNGLFFVDYTDLDGDTQVVRYQVSPDDPDRADPASAETILTVEQPAANHNGGLLLFGPEGDLYVGLGDGGGGNGQNGQKLDTLLGKILRLDVDHPADGKPYGIPADNPFVDRPDARPEIWVWGVRNPWRFSFDRATGDLWIGDVGSSLFEEIDLVPAGTSGQNFGWNLMEGSQCREPGACDAFVPPVGGFDRADGCVITGGYVYRGTALPSITGFYLYADYCSGNVWGLARTASGDWFTAGPVATGLTIASFGEDADGELELVDHDGGVYRIV
jgi:glucose/arabinose dehydrogenase